MSKNKSMEPRASEPDGDPDKAAYEEARVTDSPARVSDSLDRSSNARPASAVDTSDRGGAEQELRARLQGLGTLLTG
jgi:hypothetical protein